MLAHSGKHEHEASQQPGQRERRQPLISRLPRQADMDDSCTTPLVEPRKSRGTPSTPVPPVVKGQPPHTDEFSCDMTISPEQPQANTSFSSPPRTGDPSEEESIALARQLMAQEALGVVRCIFQRLLTVQYGTIFARRSGSPPCCIGRRYRRTSWW
ncbi:hypothetical protein MHU86_14466 [Fragilaria crotonensis]|nr:hypothetical protein MHU86_14466 [Fragilaria crotonensis]